MRRPPYHRRELDTGMTSMIDIVFLLLIFFVVTASTQIREALLPTELAATGSVESPFEPPEQEPLSVEIWLKLRHDPQTRQTIVDMNGTDYSQLQSLKEQLRALAELGPENPVILDVSPEVPLEDLVDIYDTCQAAGFHSVSFAAPVPTEGTTAAEGNRPRLKTTN